MLDIIPLEIILEIIDLVHKSDLLNLRLASRRLHQETWQAFGFAFFRIVYFDFCLGSFARLQKIAQHDVRFFVRELRVGSGWPCNNDDCNALRSDHRLGQGYQWTRESSGCLDITASEMVASFRRVLAERLSNCRAICMRQGTHERPGDRGSNTILSMTDAVYLLLFVVTGLPISSLRFESITGVGIQPQELPRRIIESPPNTAPWAEALTELRLDWDIFSDQIDLALIAATIIIRAKALRRLHLNVCRDNAAAILSRLTETLEVSPLTHLVLKRFHIKERQLSAFLRRFKDTLLHLHVDSILLDPDDWGPFLSECRHNLLLLEHFTLYNARYMTSHPLFLDAMMEWNGVPASGKFEFVVKAVRIAQGLWEFRVFGVRYQGKRDDMQKILTGLEECVRMASHDHGNGAVTAAGWKREDLPATLVIAGRLKADRFPAKKFYSVFDRPSDIALRPAWPRI